MERLGACIFDYFLKATDYVLDAPYAAAITPSAASTTGVNTEVAAIEISTACIRTKFRNIIRLIKLLFFIFHARLRSYIYCNLCN